MGQDEAPKTESAQLTPPEELPELKGDLDVFEFVNKMAALQIRALGKASSDFSTVCIPLYQNLQQAQWWAQSGQAASTRALLNKAKAAEESPE